MTGVGEGRNAQFNPKCFLHGGQAAMGVGRRRSRRVEASSEELTVITEATADTEGSRCKSRGQGVRFAVGVAKLVRPRLTCGEVGLGMDGRGGGQERRMSHEEGAQRALGQERGALLGGDVLAAAHAAVDLQVQRFALLLGSGRETEENRECTRRYDRVRAGRPKRPKTHSEKLSFLCKRHVLSPPLQRLPHCTAPRRPARTHPAPWDKR